MPAAAQLQLFGDLCQLNVPKAVKKQAGKPWFIKDVGLQIKTGQLKMCQIFSSTRANITCHRLNLTKFARVDEALASVHIVFISVAIDLDIRFVKLGKLH